MAELVRARKIYCRHIESCLNGAEQASLIAYSRASLEEMLVETFIYANPQKDSSSPDALMKSGSFSSLSKCFSPGKDFSAPVCAAHVGLIKLRLPLLSQIREGLVQAEVCVISLGLI